MSHGEVKLGQLVEGEKHRDAIHVAVAPVVAGQILNPGQHVGIVDGKATVDAPHIGIVDPFLSLAVLTDQTFWLMLYQNTAGGVRHHWTHPAFGDEPASSPGVQKAIAMLREQQELGEDAFCCGHEAVAFMEDVLSQLKS